LFRVHFLDAEGEFRSLSATAILNPAAAAWLLQFAAIFGIAPAEKPRKMGVFENFPTGRGNKPTGSGHKPAEHGQKSTARSHLATGRCHPATAHGHNPTARSHLATGRCNMLTDRRHFPTGRFNPATGKYDLSIRKSRPAGVPLVNSPAPSRL